MKLRYRENYDVTLMGSKQINEDKNHGNYVGNYMYAGIYPRTYYQTQ